MEMLGIKTESETRAKTKTKIPGKLRIYPVPSSFDEEDVKVMFQPFGKISNVELYREGKLKDVAIIT